MYGKLGVKCWICKGEMKKADVRKPEDKRCMDVVKDAWDIDKLRCAVSDWILVLIVEAIAKLLKRMNRRRRRLQSLLTRRQSVTMG